jgi:hypothetical protein
MPFAPDFGLMLRDTSGLPEDGTMSFADFPVSNIALVGDNKFSCSVNIPFDSVEYALSMDFSAAILGQMLGYADERTAQIVLSWTERGCQPETLEIDPPIHIAVVCQLGSPEANDNEIYIPLVVKEIGSTKDFDPVEYAERENE